MTLVLKNLREHALTWVIACAVAACGGSEIEKATRLVLVTDTDIEEMVSVVYRVEPPSGVPKEARGDIEPGRPAFVVLEKSDSASGGPYKVHVTGLDGAGGVVLERDAEMSFVTGKTLAVPLHLVESCLNKMCGVEQSCGPAGCADKVLGADDMSDWTGDPPTLEPGGPPDGGSDPDGSPGGDGSVPDGGGGSCTTDTHCVGGALALCEDGRVVDTMDCPGGAALCTVGSCVEGMGCTVAPLDDGSTCADGAICHDGDCVTGTLCTTNNCSPSCDSGACTLDCGEVVRCNPSCSTGSTCDVECRGTDRCNVSCETSATCTIDCGASATVCNPNCKAGSSCDITCAPGQACTGAVCGAGADCVLRCGDAVSACDFADCQDGITNCDGNVVVCGRSCP
jgi:hypothetical protein